jgi:transcriptional regulator with PAS, ATPase and Fis domain
MSRQRVLPPGILATLFNVGCNCHKSTHDPEIKKDDIPPRRDEEVPRMGIEVVQRAVDAGRLMREPVTLPDAGSESRTALVGNSRAMQGVCKEIGRVAAKPFTVLIRGETGTGKGVAARSSMS